MKEYSDGVDLSRLESGYLSNEVYNKANAGLVTACHDVYLDVEIEGKNGILLIERKGKPAQGLMWPIGGRILRGLPIEESLGRKVKEECGLEIECTQYIGIGRPFFQESPFNHGRGTDAIGLNYYAKGKGKLNLNDLHSNPTIVTPEEYKGIRDSLHPYVQDFMDPAMELFTSNF